MQTNFFHRGAGDGPHPRPQPQYDVPVTAGELKKIFSDCDDFETRTVRIGLESRLTVTVCWLDGVVSAGDVSTDVLRKQTECGRLADIASTRCTESSRGRSTAARRARARRWTTRSLI